jgi:ABC-type Fe3+-hydroxamate transport system substrate-binding protein
MTKITIIDQTGRELKISESINKIVCLVPSITELLFFFNLDDKIVGITEYCVHPKVKVDGIEKIGGPKILILKKLRNLSPI